MSLTLLVLSAIPSLRSLIGLTHPPPHGVRAEELGAA